MEETLEKFEELLLGHSTQLDKLTERLHIPSSLSQLQMVKRKLLGERAKLYASNISYLQSPNLANHIEEQLQRLRTRYDDYIKLIQELIE